MNDIHDILAKRCSTHGLFKNSAKICQGIKQQIRYSEKWPKLEPHQKESLEMIAYKISRILSGNDKHVDHWKDIAGYAILTAELLENAATKNE